MSSTFRFINTGGRRPYPLEITEHTIQTPRLQGFPNGLTIAHLTDLHGGYGRLDAVYDEMVDVVDGVKPDLVLLTGDYIDDHASRPDFPLHTYLRRLKGRLGVYGSLGNHEHRRGVERAVKLLEDSGVTLLRNQNVSVAPGVTVAGIDDLYEGQPDLNRALAGIPEDHTVIMLSHNPRLIERTGDRRLLILSGHTHGGQIVPPFLTPKAICWLHLRCTEAAGWYYNGASSLYVSRGIGFTGLPLRWNCPAEIAIHRLTPVVASGSEAASVDSESLATSTR